MMSALLFNGQPCGAETPTVDVPGWSFTKTVLAATALTLVRDGRVGLDDPVPEGPFTLRQLLRHEAGLADYHALAPYHEAVANGEAAWPVDELLRRLDAT
ncbi:Beta-lactamase [Pseudomonas sp. ok272]|nr:MULTISPECIES: serine hydrolase domain-containing protein [unclassified Pseudomonas]SEN32300.1 Beta-lactamase [Pseudomonas sp. ok272]SFN18651.1 Beta-lactamase [Pseudomonas sp. ok602]